MPRSSTTGMPHIDLTLDDLPLDTPVRIESGANGIVIVRRSDGVSAFEDSCPHAQWRVSRGEITGGLLECPGHGWVFDVASGRCVTVPAYCLKVCSVRVVAGHVRVEWDAERVPAEAQNVTA